MLRTKFFFAFFLLESQFTSIDETKITPHVVDCGIFLIRKTQELRTTNTSLVNKKVAVFYTVLLVFEIDAGS